MLIAIFIVLSTKFSVAALSIRHRLTITFHKDNSGRCDTIDSNSIPRTSSLPNYKSTHPFRQSDIAKFRRFKSVMKISTTSTDESFDHQGKIAECGILWDWATHDTESFHDFHTNEASAIRTSLLNWYRLERRKLPWRGDPGPFDGSTAGINSKSMKKAKGGADNEQTSLDSYFRKPARKKSAAVEKISDISEISEISKVNEQVIPVTGYSVWVSEIMLQQTRVEAVIPYYLAWMKSFPTVYALAEASEEEVNAHWAGLGFYRRARMLHKGAKYVVASLDGCVPDSVDELMKIDGIGRYTASAVASIAFDKCVPVVDGNVCRVLSRLKGIANNIKAPVFKDKIGWNLAEQIVSAGDGMYAGEVNQALMELGATYCAPSGTGLDPRDPLVEFYMSTKISKSLSKIKSGTGIDDFVFATMTKRMENRCALCDPDGISIVLTSAQEDLEIKNTDKSALEHAPLVGHGSFPLAPIKKPKRDEILTVVALSCETEGSTDRRWLMERRPKKGLLAGQWEFPSSCIWTSIDGNNKSKKKLIKKSAKNSVVEIPFIAVEKRQEAVDRIMDELSVVFGDMHGTGFGGQWLDKSITHTFSHVRHTMYIQHGRSPFTQSRSSPDRNEIKLRWMTESDMKSVGITSGVKKVLASVKDTSIKHQSNKVRAGKRRKKER